MNWIQKQGLQPGDSLPAEVRLCELFGVSRITVRHAIQRLVQDGYLTRRAGVGTFVRPAPEKVGSGLPKTVVLVISNAHGSFMLDLVAGVEAGVRQNGYDLMLQICQDDPVRERQVLDQLLLKRPAGVVIFPVDSAEPFHPNCFHYLRLVEAGVPVLFVDRYLSQLPIGFVVGDDEAAMHTLTNHLIQQGHTDIGYIDSFVNVTSVIDRRRGYERALREAGVSAGRCLMIQTQRSAQMPDQLMAYDCVRAAADSGPIPRALVSCNTNFALGALRALNDLGLKVPEDVVLAGFDDVPEAANSEPTLTVWQSPSGVIGREAAAALCDLISTPADRVPRVKVPGSLLVRESTRTTTHSGKAGRTAKRE